MKKHMIFLSLLLMTLSVSAQLEPFEENGKWGFILPSGEETPALYDNVEALNEGMAQVELNGKWGYVDAKGHETVPCKYDFAGMFSEGFAAVKINGKYGFIDKSGLEIVPCEYDEVAPFSEGVAVVKKEGRYAFIDPAGKKVDLKVGSFEYVGSFKEGKAPVMQEGVGVVYYLNKKGERIKQ